MATKKKARVAPAALSPIDVTSRVKETDVVLINRNQTDSQTTVEDLAKGVGGILNIDGLAVEIDTNAASIEVIKTEIGIGGGGNGTASLDERIDKLENHNFEGGAAASGDFPAGGTHQRRLDALEAEVGLGGGGGGGGSITDQLDYIVEEQALQDGWIGRAAGSAVPVKSHELRINHLENGLDDLETEVADNTVAIAKNEDEIIVLGQEVDKLKGALVYKGVADFNAAPPTATAGEYYAASGDVANPHAGWNATGTVSQGDYYAFDGSNWAKVGNTESVHDVVDDFHVKAKSGNATALTYQNATEMDAAVVALEVEVAKKLNMNISQLPPLTT